MSKGFLQLWYFIFFFFSVHTTTAWSVFLASVFYLEIQYKYQINKSVNWMKRKSLQKYVQLLRAPRNLISKTYPSSDSSTTSNATDQILSKIRGDNKSKYKILRIRIGLAYFVHRNKVSVFTMFESHKTWYETSHLTLRQAMKDVEHIKNFFLALDSSISLSVVLYNVSHRYKNDKHIGYSYHNSPRIEQNQ